MVNDHLQKTRPGYIDVGDECWRRGKPVISIFLKYHFIHDSFIHEIQIFAESQFYPLFEI